MSRNELLNDEWSFLACGQCKFWGKNCKRIDHKHFQFAKPWFRCYDEGQYASYCCRDFVPADWCVWLKQHWTSLDDYYGEDVDKGYVALCIDGDQSVRYYVLRKDWNNNTFVDDNGKLKWCRKMYYKIDRSSPIGYRLVEETNESC